MPSLETLAVFTLAAVLMNLSPGPSNFYVMARSLEQGARAGMVAGLGLATGSLVHIAGAALGLSLIFQYSPLAYTIFKTAGAAYLIWLGLRILLSAEPAPGAPAAPAAMPLAKVFRQSALVEILNPKTALFFLAFLPQFVDVAAGPVTPQILLLGAIVTLTALPCDFAVAVGSSRAARLIANHPIATRIQAWLSGSILIGLGAYILATRRVAD